MSSYTHPTPQGKMRHICTAYCVLTGRSVCNPSVLPLLVLLAPANVTTSCERLLDQVRYTPGYVLVLTGTASTQRMYRTLAGATAWYIHLAMYAQVHRIRGVRTVRSYLLLPLPGMCAGHC